MQRTTEILDRQHLSQNLKIKGNKLLECLEEQGSRLGTGVGLEGHTGPVLALQPRPHSGRRDRAAHFGGNEEPRSGRWDQTAPRLERAAPPRTWEDVGPELARGQQEHGGVEAPLAEARGSRAGTKQGSPVSTWAAGRALRVHEDHRSQL